MKILLIIIIAITLILSIMTTYALMVAAGKADAKMEKIYQKELSKQMN